MVAEADMPPSDLRSRNLALMERLNPGRIFRIRMPVDELVRRWTSELRPGALKSMGNVDAFINKSHLFGVFDIDGNFDPKVMGVRYFVAYSLRDKKPDKLRAPTERRAFHERRLTRS